MFILLYGNIFLYKFLGSLMLRNAILFLIVFFISCSGNVVKSDTISNSSSDVTSKTLSYKDYYENKPITHIKKPTEFILNPAEKLIFSNDDIHVNLYAREFAQGNAGYIEIIFKKELKITKILFSGTVIPFTKTPWGARAFFPISPEAKAGMHKFVIEYTESFAKKLEAEVNIKNVDFPVATSILDLGKYSDKEYTGKAEFKEYIEECARRKEKAFSSVSDDSIGNTLSHPRDIHKVTGDFWKKRIYATYKKKGKKKVPVAGHTSYHRGLDLRGDIGAPVFAMADGKIVLAYKMFYEGNMVVIDHGNEIFTYYMHMDSIDVKEGDFVRAGDLIGKVGSTGTSTAPHLHVALRMRGVHLHPLSLLYLPVSR